MYVYVCMYIYIKFFLLLQLFKDEKEKKWKKKNEKKNKKKWQTRYPALFKPCVINALKKVISLDR